MKSPWSRLKSWVRSVSRGKRLDGDMESEIRFHLEARAADLEHEGLGPREAMRQARLEFGTVAAHKDAMRSSLGLRWWDELRDDLRYGFRILRKSPGFTSLAVASLALAIGANTTIFSVANEMLLEHLGVPHPGQLRLLTMSGDPKAVIHMIWGEKNELPDPKHQNQLVRYDVFTYPIFQQLRANNHVFDDLFAFKSLGRVNVTIAGAAQPADAQLVSGNFYQQMQVQPALGRVILPSDDGAPGTGTVAVISDGFWSRAFGRSPAVLGQVIDVDMTPVTIVGVNSRSFSGAESAQHSPDLFMPLSTMPLFRAPFGDSGPVLASTQALLAASNGPHPARFFRRTGARLARCSPGCSGTGHHDHRERRYAATHQGGGWQQRSELPCAPICQATLRNAGDGGRCSVDGVCQHGQPYACPCLGETAGDERTPGARRRPFPRSAPGIDREPIAFIHGGNIRTAAGLSMPDRIAPLDSQGVGYSYIEVPFDWKVFAFTATLTIGTGVLFGILPAWAATRAEIGAALKQGAQTATRRRHAWSGKGIVAFQIAVSTVLVVAAWLFLRTLINLNRIDPGFAVDHLVLFEIDAPSLRYPAPKMWPCTPGWKRHYPRSPGLRA